MDDEGLLRRVEWALPEMPRFDRAVYTLARLRVQHGSPLKPAQRRHLIRLLGLVEQLRRKVADVPGRL